jgi:hypothetical protein
MGRFTVRDRGSAVALVALTKLAQDQVIADGRISNATLDRTGLIEFFPVLLMGHIHC